jgi:hypothetical protein
MKFQGKTFLIFKYKHTSKCNYLFTEKVQKPKIRKGNLTQAYLSWKLNYEALDCTLWRTRFGRGYGPVLRQTTE